VKNMSSEVLVYSHSGGELWGLAVHPNIPDLFVTVGDDCTLRVWSLNLNKMIHSVDLGSAARSVTFHPSGAVLAVGFMERKKSGGIKEKEKEKDKDKEKNKIDGQMKSVNLDGAVHLYSFTVDSTSTSTSNSNSNSNSNSSSGSVTNYAAISVLKVSHGCDTVAWVNDVTFSPTGEILAVGSHDTKMYFYGIPGIPQGGGPLGDVWGQCLKKTKFVFDKHSSAVLHADFSSDGKYMQTDSQVR
jgi:WD40 repeat protein